MKGLVKVNYFIAGKGETIEKLVMRISIMTDLQKKAEAKKPAQYTLGTNSFVIPNFFVFLFATTPFTLQM